ncbi:NAD(P)-binding domain-containing protein [Microbacterium sp. zg.Y1090]|uniref:ketopantoate reductase family protein n=1 Tax=Microbacterium TaxID=33882 RepID=UPI00214D051C|nr:MULTISPECIES: 2-dehydropantoate 2-reductase N-terminal domain-containing protein [unclassified Microbacterium]MCR2812412.1 NAD(P)-binding domain-containing protein [Microbacterium sp. zg.Y1084]MCR2817787.1 NAD(P)-binding domain-containing protein [Microbacterium sp. zg.Y1090]MDL5485569.1 2-dehydropantoate 2-reductase N-terminal domain-containing protein [Microbacterium sp. zg-Y1211]WIM28740.1 2-dehydropantoate 2-reductase N-terminal domain-containing protein [Microbacterium sp. zg-Y1090]
MSRYLVIGAGAVGGLLAAQWAAAQVPVVLIAREPTRAAIARDGVRVRRPGGDDVVAVEVAGSLAVARPTAADTVVLAVKAPDVEEAVAAIAWTPLADGRGVVADLPILTLQGGLAAERIALRRFATVIGVSLGAPVGLIAPGVIAAAAHPIVGAAWLGGYPHSLPAEEERHRLALAAAGFAASVEPDIAAAKRRKLIASLAGAVEVFDAPQEQLERAADAVEAEARAVFAAAGLAVAPPRPGARLEVGEVPGFATGRGSVWQGFARGAASEADHLSGEVALVARQTGVDAPLNTAVARALGALAHRRGRPGELPLPAEFGSALFGGVSARTRR